MVFLLKSVTGRCAVWCCHCVLLCLAHMEVMAQNPEKEYHMGMEERVVIKGNNKITEAELYEGEKKIRPRLTSVYSWYAYGKIHETQGDYNGMLLHGPTVAYSMQHRLLQKGHYRYGQKNGEWKTWNEQEQLLHVCEWKHGLLHGTCLYFDSTGRANAQKKYRQGQEVPAKVKKVKTKKIKPEKAPAEPKTDTTETETNAGKSKKEKEQPEKSKKTKENKNNKDKGKNTKAEKAPSEKKNARKTDKNLSEPLPTEEKSKGSEQK